MDHGKTFITGWRRWAILFSAGLTLCAIATGGSCQVTTVKNWLCYYGTTFGSSYYSRFDLVVLDGNNHPPLVHSSPGSPLIFAYVSFGEMNPGNPLWHEVKDQPYLVRENALWGSWLVDIRDSAWQALLFEQVIPAIYAQGFDGVFIDTLDSSLSLVTGEEAEEYAGVEATIIAMMHRLKQAYPNKLIALNRGLPLLPELAPIIDLVVVENLYSYSSGPEQGYTRVDSETQTLLLEQIKAGRLVNPDLPVLTLDYAGSNQTDLIRDAIAFSRQRGFTPYISTLELNDIYFHTLDHD